MPPGVVRYSYRARPRGRGEDAARARRFDDAPAARPVLALSVLAGNWSTLAPRYRSEDRVSALEAILRPISASPPAKTIANATPSPYGSAALALLLVTGRCPGTPGAAWSSDEPSHPASRSTVAIEALFIIPSLFILIRRTRSGCHKFNAPGLNLVSFSTFLIGNLRPVCCFLAPLCGASSGVMWGTGWRTCDLSVFGARELRTGGLRGQVAKPRPRTTVAARRRNALETRSPRSA
jgi:hypothetical protein